MLLLDKIGLSEFKYYSKITSLSKNEWKTLITKNIAKLQHKADSNKLDNCKNELIKYKFKIWDDCDNYYVGKSLLQRINHISNKYNPYVWRILKK